MEGKDQSAYRRISRCRDVLLSLFALIFLSPLMLLIVAAIVIESPGAGPVFVQDRVGKNGEIFHCLKFRTMVPDAETQFSKLLSQNEMDGPVFKIRRDPRITRVGKFLRRSGLDELLQLVNVLRGEMSLVGPRPAPPREVSQYGDYERQRLKVLPGITCYWQVQPNRNAMSFRQWMELDMKYIREQSLRTDFIILLHTVIAVLRMDGQ